MRVLLGDCGAIVRAGLTDVLRSTDLGITTSETSNDQILPALDRSPNAVTDVVVIDLSQDDADGLVIEIIRTHPEVKVIACSAAGPTMRVFPPFHAGESFELAFNPSQLIHNVLH